MKPGSIEKFVQELKRRRVFRGIVVYGASTLLIFEAADNLCNAFGIEAVPRWFLVLLGMGFLGSLWFSWIYDFTPGGIVKTEPAKDHPVPIPQKKLKTYRLTTFISVAIIIGLLSFRFFDDITAKKIASIEKSIAVLPLPDDALNPGIARECEEFLGYSITTRLLNVRDYRVVPWEDTRKYSREGRNYAGIGQDLSAAILVDWRPLQIRVEKFLSVSLIAAQDGHTLWSDQYKIKDNWSSSEISKYSRKISKKITRRLRIFLTLEERELLSEQPVSARATMLASLGNVMAHDAFEMIQTGNDINETGELGYYDSISFERAIRYYTEAIEEDSTLAEAYANRAKALLWAKRAGIYDVSILDECEKDIIQAFTLHPDLPEAHLSMGLYYYYGKEAYKLSHVSFEKAVALRPNDYEYLFYLTKIKSTLGNWEEVRPLANKVFESNPLNALYLTNLGTIYLYLNDFARSIECQDRAIELIPGWPSPFINKIESLLSMGELSKARAVVSDGELNTGEIFYRTSALLDLYEGKYYSATTQIELASVSEFDGFGETEGDAFLLKAKIHRHDENYDQAKEYYKLAINFFRDLIMFDPENSLAYSKLGVAYAGIGENLLAVKNGAIALGLIELHKDAIIQPYILYSIMEMYAILGDHESALRLMPALLDIQSHFTTERIKLDPDIKHLLDDFGFVSINH